MYFWTMTEVPTDVLLGSRTNQLSSSCRCPPPPPPNKRKKMTATSVIVPFQLDVLLKVWPQTNSWFIMFTSHWTAYIDTHIFLMKDSFNRSIYCVFVTGTFYTSFNCFRIFNLLCLQCGVVFVWFKCHTVINF